MMGEPARGTGFDHKGQNPSNRQTVDRVDETLTIDLGTRSALDR